MTHRAPRPGPLRITPLCSVRQCYQCAVYPPPGAAKLQQRQPSERSVRARACVRAWWSCTCAFFVPPALAGVSRGAEPRARLFRQPARLVCALCSALSLCRNRFPRTTMRGREGLDSAQLAPGAMLHGEQRRSLNARAAADDALLHARMFIRAELAPVLRIYVCVCGCGYCGPGKDGRSRVVFIFGG